MNRRLAVIAAVVLGLAAVLAALLWSRGAPPEVPAGDTPDAGAAADAPGPRLQSMRARAAAADAGAAAPLPPGVIATFGWGNGAGKLGRNRPDEANPEGPMSLTRDARGNTWVLDQVNGRLVKLDATGKPAGDVPLPVQTPQDVAFTKDGTAAVLDRLVDGAVALVGPDGKQLGELKLVGKGIEAGGAITALVTDGNDVYVEREHGDLVKLGDSKGKPDPDRPEVPGRPTRDGSAFISANIIDAPSGHVAVTSIDRATREHRYTCDVPMGAPILNLNLLDTDRSGVIYLGAVVEKAPAPSGGGDGQYGIFVLCLDPLDGRPLGRAVLPANTDADETFRELTVMDEGGVLFLYRTEQQSQLMRADCR